MSQVLNANIVHTDKYYKREVNRLLDKIRRNSEKMEQTQKEIDALQKQSAKNLRRIEARIQSLEKLVM